MGFIKIFFASKQCGYEPTPPDCYTYKSCLNGNLEVVEKIGFVDRKKNLKYKVVHTNVLDLATFFILAESFWSLRNHHSNLEPINDVYNFCRNETSVFESKM